MVQYYRIVIPSIKFIELHTRVVINYYDSSYGSQKLVLRTFKMICVTNEDLI